MSNLWPVPIFLSVAVAFLLVWAAGRRFFAGTSAARRSFWCPFRGRNVQVDFAESSWDGSLVDVEACSAFTPPAEVGCDKACLELKRLPTSRAPLPGAPLRGWVW